MKKKIGMYKGTYGRKRRLTWIILILVFSIISISAAGTENSTESQVSDSASLEWNIYAGNNTGNSESIKDDRETGKYDETQSKGDTVEKPGQKQEEGGNTENSDSEDANPEQKTGEEKDSGDLEDKDEGNPGESNNKDGQENGKDKDEGNPGESNNTDGQENGKDKDEGNPGESNDTDSQENGKDKDKDKGNPGESNNTDSQENGKDKDKDKGKPEEADNEDSQENGKDKDKDKDKDKGNPGESDNKDSQENGKDKDKDKDKGNPGESDNKDSQENDKDKNKGNPGESNNTDSQKDGKDKDKGKPGKYNENQKKGETVEKTEQKRKTITDSSKNKESNLKSEVKAGNKTEIQKSTGVKTESKTKTFNGTKSQESAGVKSEIRVGNLTYSAENESVISEIKAEKSSWNNLKFILSYPYPLRSFYTVNESVKISYKGPEALGEQNVDIYLVKEQNPSFPENFISNDMNESKIRLKDILNSPESYIQIPAALNKGGDLSPLTLGPLSAGSYWVLITLAGNETETLESEKEILSANYFEVLEYRMEAKVPYTAKEGENLEVRLNLKNVPAHKSYTYWVVLIREDAYTVHGATNPSWMISGRPLVNGVDIIRSLETNLTEYKSKSEKDELKSEIQTLIGKGNGTIIIGEESQSTLSLKNLELPPGNYLLLAGAYGNDEGRLAGIAKKELRILANSYLLGLKSSSGIHTFGDSSVRTNSIFETPGTFIFESIKPYIQANAIVEIVRNPPKVPSFLLGFAGTLLIGLVILRRKR
ncbi:MAG: TIGR04279 domain-containing protein [Methanosarcina sp.]|nr:TIGR04279 domain-containing protein [Methanosarcina sp.]